ncbi:hypothetical protein JOQ06_001591 [Pogonophryne albipinna]|uniref:TROVE domain-containing protein n=1 Tax=Pogonophryne albipinna TaxID=1090488 RepID=A0AAD6B327_9TELE|nr:hypothetical protein JOQ06_001591 [Pogonophryne albipinna]
MEPSGSTISSSSNHPLNSTGGVCQWEQGRGAEVVEEIKRFSQEGRAVTLDPSLFALALCSQQSELKTRQVAFKTLKEVCRDPAHLFSFIQQKKELREAIALISKYVTKGWKEVQLAYSDKEKSEEVGTVLSYLEMVEKVKHSCDEAEIIHLIDKHKLEREQLLTDHLKSKQVWRALLKDMLLQSVLKILGKMTSNKVLEPGSSDTQALCDRFQSQTALTKAKIHPFHILLSSKNYKRDQGYQVKTKWEPDSSILKAMDSAFYKSFMNVEPVAKRFVVAVDVSTSPSSVVPGTSISTAVAAAAIAMVFARTEADTHVLAYSEGVPVPCSISADMTLAQATFELVKIPGGSTDCTLPISWATESGKAADVFIILTNNPVWTFTASPVPSLKKHRQQSGANSKLVMCGLTSIGHAIADTEDRGLVSICGLDLGAFSVIRNLAQDLI